MAPAGRWIPAPRHWRARLPAHATARRLRGLICALLCSLLAAGCTLPALPNVSLLEKRPVDGPPIIVRDGRRESPAESAATISRLARRSAADPLVERQIRLMESVSGMPLVAGNAVTLLTGRQVTTAMEQAIRGARDSVDLETYIFGDMESDRALARLLIRKSAQGVDVNLIYDAVGSRDTPASVFRALRRGGVHVLEFNPINPFHVRRKWFITRRDHRKILVVDGRIAFTGGVNIGNVYSSTPTGRTLPWRDTDVAIRGPVVAQFQRLFFSTWRHQDGPSLPHRDFFPPLVPQGDDYVMVIGSSPGKKHRLTYEMYQTAFAAAVRYIHVTSAYFVPNRQTLAALIDAAKRGVHVKLILPSRSDVPLAMYAGRSFYTQLLKAGVKIYERKHALLHAKTATIDGVWSTVGSTNMDMWSFASNNEVNAIILGRDFGRQMEAMFEHDIKESRQVTLSQWEKRPFRERFREFFARLFRHWL
ncbi:MAG: phospholipase D-like domain-containing protein [Betaproteobacteria bacterium]|nr:phospholipase D-like domain-containing protein [Betaproteobacteria bacterium]